MFFIGSPRLVSQRNRCRMRCSKPDRPLTVMLVLGAIWLAATLGNLNKAFHVDDAAYLEIAQWVARHPLHPMQGTINWGGSDPAPIADINQPPLLSYCIAGWGFFFGHGEASLHLMESLFALAAIVFFYLLARQAAPRSALLLGALFAMTPSLVVGQNVMTDVPMIALWNAFYFVLLAWRTRSDSARYGLAGALAGTAILIKYTSLTLVPAMALHMILTRRRRQWPWLLAPLAMLGGWSLWNAWDYGRVHVWDRHLDSMTLRERLGMAIDWLICLGAIMPQAVVLHAGALARLGARARRVAWTALAMAIMVVIVIPPAYHLTIITKQEALIVLGLIFLVNGVVLAWRTAKKTIQWGSRRLAIFSRKASSAEDVDCLQGMLHYWAWSAAAFAVFFAPFMATRHVFPSLPAMLLILGRRDCRRAPVPWRAAGVALTLLLTSCLALADWTLANAYRQAAFEIARRAPPGTTIWFVGHWGWQYYAKQAGMRQMTGSRPEARPGDLVTWPERGQLQDVSIYLQTRPVGIMAVPQTLSFLPSVDHGSFYATTLPLLPWHVSRDPIDVFDIEEIVSNDAPRAASGSNGTNAVPTRHLKYLR
jgi:hypothetical protein